MASKGPKTVGKTPVKTTVGKAAAVAAKPVAQTGVESVEASAVKVPFAAPVVAEAADVVAVSASAPVVPETPVVTPPVIEAAPAATPVAAAPAPNVQKEIVKMATAFEAPKFEAPKAFTDFNDRAKSAMEKGGKMVEDMNEFAKGNVEALVESSKITAKGIETMSQDAAEYSRKSFEGFTATLKNLAAVKSPADFFKLQSDYVRSSFDSAVAETSKGTEAFIKLASDAAQPISNRFAVAAEKVKTVA